MVGFSPRVIHHRGGNGQRERPRERYDHFGVVDQQKQWHHDHGKPLTPLRIPAEKAANAATGREALSMS